MEGAGSKHLRLTRYTQYLLFPLQLVDLVYNLLSKFRIPLGEKMDAVLALRRMKMTSEGIEHCVDDEEECHAEW